MSAVVKYAIVGCGSVSDNRYFPNLSRLPNARLAAVCDAVESRAKAKGEAHGVPYFTDVPTLLARVDFDLLVNLTHVPAHYEVSLQALQAGKHVYTQKPMTVTTQEADRLIAEAAKRKLKLVAEEAKALQFSHRTMRKLIDDGAIGKVVWARATCSHWGPATIDNWPTDPEWFYRKGAGPLRDVGIERLHGLTHLLGPAKRVTALSGINQSEVVVRGGLCQGKRIEVTEDDLTLLTLDFGNSVFATLDAAWVNYSSKATQVPQLEIYGQKGVMTLRGAETVQGYRTNPFDFVLQLYRDEPEHGIRGWTTVDPIPPAKPDPYPAVMGLVHAIECIQNDSKPILSGEHARHCIEIIEKAYEAARTGTTQRLETVFYMPGDLDKAQQGDSARSWLGQIAAWAMSFTVFEQIGPAAVLSVMLKGLGASPLHIGLLVSMVPVGMAVQALGAPLLEARPSRKKTLIVLTALSSLGYLAMAVCLGWLGGTRPGAAIVAVAVCFACIALVCGMREICFFELAGATVGNRRRGRFFGIRDAVTAGTGIVASLLIFWVLERGQEDFPKGYVWLLTGAFLVVAGAALALVLVEDRPRAPASRRPHVLRLLADLPSILTADRPFARYLLWRTLLQASRSAHAFLVVFCLTRFALGDATTGLLLLVAETSRLLAGVPAGWLTDHLGPRRGILVVSLASTALACVAMAACGGRGGIVMACGLFALFGVFKALWFSADSAMVLTLTSPERHLRYVSLALLMPLPATLLAPVVSGLVIERFGYVWAFALSACLALAATWAAASVPRAVGATPTLSAPPADEPPHA